MRAFGGKTEDDELVRGAGEDLTRVSSCAGLKRGCGDGGIEVEFAAIVGDAGEAGEGEQDENLVYTSTLKPYDEAANEETLKKHKQEKQTSPR